MYKYNFEKLEAWQLSRKLVVKLYKATAEFPSDEKYGIVSQIRRAAISVCSNLAEGSSRSGPKEQFRFYNMSYGSLIEILNQLIISNDLGWINTVQFESLRNEIDSISAKIGALRKSIRTSAPKP